MAQQSTRPAPYARGATGTGDDKFPHGVRVAHAKTTQAPPSVVAQCVSMTIEGAGEIEHGRLAVNAGVHPLNETRRRLRQTLPRMSISRRPDATRLPPGAPSTVIRIGRSTVAIAADDLEERRASRKNLSARPTITIGGDEPKCSRLDSPEGRKPGKDRSRWTPFGGSGAANIAKFTNSLDAGKEHNQQLLECYLGTYGASGQMRFMIAAKPLFHGPWHAKESYDHAVGAPDTAVAAAAWRRSP